jgi:zinc-finger-containing domain
MARPLPLESEQTKIVFCDYCAKEALCVSGRTIYPHRKDLTKKWFYACEPCDAYVGCHTDSIGGPPDPKRPLGRLANKELRAAKSLAHRAFDPLWKSERMPRARAYSWLSQQLGIDGKTCHIGMFDIAMCNKVVEVCKEFRNAESGPILNDESSQRRLF